MEYKITVNVTQKDYMDFNADYFKSSKSFIVCLAICVVFLLFESYTSILAKGWSAGLISCLLSLIPLALFIVFMLIFLPLKMKSLYKSDKAVQEPQELTLSEDKINGMNARGTFVYSASEIDKVRLGKKVIALFVSKQKAVLIPRHCFASKDEEVAVVEFIKARYMKNKNGKK